MCDIEVQIQKGKKHWPRGSLLACQHVLHLAAKLYLRPSRSKTIDYNGVGLAIER